MSIDSPTGIIPETLMYRERRKQAIAYIVSLPLPGFLKRDLLFAWARTVRVKVLEREVIEVINSGIEPESRK